MTNSLVLSLDNLRSTSFITESLWTTFAHCMIVCTSACEDRWHTPEPLTRLIQCVNGQTQTWRGHCIRLVILVMCATCHGRSWSRRSPLHWRNDGGLSWTIEQPSSNHSDTPEEHFMPVLSNYTYGQIQWGGALCVISHSNWQLYFDTCKTKTATVVISHRRSVRENKRKDIRQRYLKQRVWTTYLMCICQNFLLCHARWWQFLFDCVIRWHCTPLIPI